MKVAIIVHSFNPAVSYQENIWAEQLAKAGHHVRVIESGSPRVERVELGPNLAIEVESVPALRLPRMIYLSRRVAEAVWRFQPDLILVIGDKQFAWDLVVDQRLAGIPMVPFFSENSAQKEYDWRKAGLRPGQRLAALGYHLLRGRSIRRLCRRSTILVANTPQTRAVLMSLFRSAPDWADIDRKIVEMPLGFSPDSFGFRPELRRSVREELGVKPDEILVCASSRFSPDKEAFLSRIVQGLSQVMRREPDVRAVIIGFDDGPMRADVSARVGAEIDATGMADRFIRHGFAGRDRLNALYNAADVAVFGRASISCQESLGTGVLACFSNLGALDHLVRIEEQGVFFDPDSPDDLAAKLTKAAQLIRKYPDHEQRETFRRRMTDASRWLGYDQIIVSVLEKVRERVPSLPIDPVATVRDHQATDAEPGAAVNRGHRVA